MKKSIMITVVAVVLIISACVTGALILSNDGNNKDGPGGPVTVTDSLGREVAIDSVDRIVSVSALPTAILCGLGMSSNLVGVSHDGGVYDEDPFVIGLTQDDFPRAVIDGLKNGTIEDLQGMYNMSAETMVSIDSDLIVMETFGTNPDIRNALDELGATYMVITVNTIEDIYSSIELLGKAVSKTSAAERMISEMRSAINKISAWCESIVNNELNGQKYNVALMVTSTYVVGSGYIGGRIIESLHVNNVFKEIVNNSPMSKESLVAGDPDVLIYNHLGMGDGVTDPEAYIQSLYGDPVLGNLSAAKKGLVFALSDGARQAATSANHGIVRAYAMYAMFIYQDHLDFDIPSVLTGNNYAEYLSEFWEMIDK